jgi:hypothetical protein
VADHLVRSKTHAAKGPSPGLAVTTTRFVAVLQVQLSVGRPARRARTPQTASSRRKAAARAEMATTRLDRSILRNVSTDRLILRTAWVRREVPHPGAPLTFTDLHGYRYQLCLISLPDPDIAFLEALYRGRGRCGQVIRDLKATGLAHLPSADFAAN